MSDTEPPTPDPPAERPTKPRNDLWTWIGIIAGAWGLLALIDEISPVVIYGKLRTWLDAYSLFVDHTVGVLFGWIEIGWFEIHIAEQHLLLLTAVVVGVPARALALEPEAGGRWDFARWPLPDRIMWGALRTAIVFAVVGFAVGAGAICSFLLPWYASIIVLLFIILGITLGYLNNGTTSSDNEIARRLFREQSIRMSLAFAALIFLNYTFFRIEAWQ